MKAGTQLPVTVEGFNVATAVIEEIADGRATIYIPATRFVLGIQTSLTDLTPEVDRDVTTQDGIGSDEGSDAKDAVEAADNENV